MITAFFQKNKGRSFSSAKAFFFVLSVLFLLNGCSLFHSIFGSSEEEVDPTELMNEGNENFERGSYKAAIEAFQKVKDRYPYSRYAITAEIRMADALYFSEEYGQALEAYDGFEKLHPKHKDIPYVIYQRGMCHFMQVRSSDREQGNTQKAREEFERLISRFPRDEYADRARRNLRQCLIYMSEYEIYVGHFYFKRGFYRAALARYTYAIENYPDLGQYHEALEYIGRCKEKLAMITGPGETKKSFWPLSIWK